MRTLLKEDFQKEFLIYKRLDSSKSTLTCIAMVEGTDKNPFPVFLKETDVKRAEIYDKLTRLWNPHIADTYEVLKVTNSDKPDVPRYFAVTEYVTATGSPNNESISHWQSILSEMELSVKKWFLFFVFNYALA